MGAVAVALDSTASAVFFNNTSYVGTTFAKTSVSTGSNLAKTLSSFAKVATPVISRANPYVMGAYALYEAYNYFVSENSDATPIAQSADNTSTVPVSSTLDSSGLGTYDETISNLGSGNVVTLENIDVDSLTSSDYDGQTLLSVLQENNRAVVSSMGTVVKSTNAIAESSSNIAKSVNSLGVILSQIASDNSAMASITTAFYIDFLKVLTDAFPARSDEPVGDDLESMDVSEDGYAYPEDSNKAITVTETVVDSSVDDASDTETASIFDLSAVVSAISGLSTSINPDGRADYFPKQNEIADYHLTPADIKDLDGQTVVNDTPLNVKTRSEASTARKHTDENNFELDDDDFDMWDSLPEMDFLNYVGNSSIYE